MTRAIARADAKDRLRTAVAVRRAGIGITLFSVPCLTSPSAWYTSLPSLHEIDAHFWHAVVTMSVTLLAGFVCLALGPIVIGAGNLLVRRARELAASDPVTAVVIDQPL